MVRESSTSANVVKDVKVVECVKIFSHSLSGHMQWHKSVVK